MFKQLFFHYSVWFGFTSKCCFLLSIYDSNNKITYPCLYNFMSSLCVYHTTCVVTIHAVSSVAVSIQSFNAITASV